MQRLAKKQPQPFLDVKEQKEGKKGNLGLVSSTLS